MSRRIVLILAACFASLLSIPHILNDFRRIIIVVAAIAFVIWGVQNVSLDVNVSVGATPTPYCHPDLPSYLPPCSLS